MTKVLVTGASGFVGRVLCRRLAEAGIAYRAAARAPRPTSADCVQVGGVGPATAWDEALAGITDVIHLAARAHLPGQHGTQALAAFRWVNVEGTRRLAEQASATGIRRLVLVSSIGANGSRTGNVPFREIDAPAPTEEYAISKLEAEMAAREVAAEGRLELTVVRPTLVYGPGNPGNMLRLLRLLQSRIPLPLASVVNQRSLIGVENLADLLVRCVTMPAAAGQLFLASDGEDISTPELLRVLAQGLGTRARLWPFPVGLGRLLASAGGFRREFDSLCGNLQVDSSKARVLLAWQPARPLREGLLQTAAWYRTAGQR